MDVKKEVKSKNASFKRSEIKKCQNLVGFHKICHLSTVKNLPFYSFCIIEAHDSVEPLSSDGKWHF